MFPKIAAHVSGKCYFSFWKIFRNLYYKTMEYNKNENYFILHDNDYDYEITLFEQNQHIHIIIV